MRTQLISRLLIAILFLTGWSHQLRSQAPAQSEDVMLQAFYWDSYTDSKWTTLNDQAYEIAQYFSLVWLPPSGNALAGNNMGYAPVYYFDQNSAFGTKSELKDLIASLNQYGSGAVADIVVNHRNGVSNWTNFPAETYLGVTYTWGPEAICNTDEVKYQTSQATPTGAADTGDDFNGARDIDHTNANVRATIKAYLDFMKDEMGYAGWRYDMTKGFSPGYIAEYNNSAGADYSVGEYFDGNYDLCNNWINGAQKTSTTFDFPLKFRLNEAFAGDLTKLCWTYSGVNQPAGLIHNPEVRRYATTFVDNHDTYRDQSKFTGNVPAANAFILCSPGIPTVFLPHWQAHKDAIRPMIAARKAARIHSESSVNVIHSAYNLYVGEITGKAGKLIVKIGSGSYNAPSGFNLITFGNDYAIWSDIAVAEPLTMDITPESGYYPEGVDVTFTTYGGRAPVTVYYTLDGQDPDVNATQISSGGTLRITQNSTLKAFARDADGKMTAVVSKKFKTTLEEITVRWKNDLGWTKMNLYSWVPGTTFRQLTGDWPGTTLTANSEGWYSHTFTGEATVNVIFNNGSAQTVDITNVTESSDFRINTEMSGGKYTVTLLPNVSTSLESQPMEGAVFYPNPARDVISFIAPERIKSVVVYSLNGQMLSTYSQPTTIDISWMPGGVYVLQTNNEDGTATVQRLMVQ